MRLTGGECRERVVKFSDRNNVLEYPQKFCLEIRTIPAFDTLV